MTFKHLIRIALVFLALLAARPALAQDRPHLDLSGGYQYALEFADFDDVRQYKNGFFASAGWNVLNRVAVVGEFSQSALTLEVGDSARFAPVDAKVYTAMGGGRVRPGNGGFFVQALFGQLAVEEKGDTVLGRRETTRTETAFQPGVGFDIGIGQAVAARILIDYRMLMSDEDAFGRQMRIGVGAAVSLF
jgi:hypothetical protein